MLVEHACIFTPEPRNGLLNPGCRVDFRPGSEWPLLAGFLWTLTSVYVFVVVLWISRRLERIPGQSHGDTDRSRFRQPVEMESLKNAIRAGDLETIRRQAAKTELWFGDEHLLTPYELAELYGDPEVIETVREAYQVQLGPKLGMPLTGPKSRFSLTQGMN